MELNSVVFLRLFSFCFLHAKRAAELFDSPPDIQYDYEKN